MLFLFPSFNLTGWTKTLTLNGQKHHLEFIKGTAYQASVQSILSVWGGTGNATF